MKVKICDLTKSALDYAVAVAEGRTEIKVFAPSRHKDCGTICEGHKDVMACASSVSRANWTPIAIKEKKNAS